MRYFGWHILQGSAVDLVLWGMVEQQIRDDRVNHDDNNISSVNCAMGRVDELHNHRSLCGHSKQMEAHLFEKFKQVIIPEPESFGLDPHCVQEGVVQLRQFGPVIVETLIMLMVGMDINSRVPG